MTAKRLACAALAALALAGAGCGGAKPANPMAALCRQVFAQRIGHDLGDDGFWRELQVCARQSLLPEGQNDPAYYQ